MNRCIATIACGSAPYFKMAFNLAVSLKYHGCKIPFVLIAHGPSGWNSIKPYHKGIIDRVIWLKDEHAKPFYNKTLVNDYLAEYDQFLFVDADSLAMRDPSPLFEDTSTPFKAIIEKQGTYKNHKISVAWCNVDELYEHYVCKHSNTFSEINSSVMLCNRSDTLNDIFTLAEHFYAAEPYPKAELLGPRHAPHKSHYPDELAFETAMLFMEYTPPRWRPFHTHYSRTRTAPMPYAIAVKKNPNAYFYTMPGDSSNVHGTMWKDYNRMQRHYTLQLAQRIHGKASALGEGMKVNPRQKAANGLNIWPDIRRKPGRPQEIQNLIEKYS